MRAWAVGAAEADFGSTGASRRLSIRVLPFSHASRAASPARCSSSADAHCPARPQRSAPIFLLLLGQRSASGARCSRARRPSSRAGAGTSGLLQMCQNRSALLNLRESRLARRQTPARASRCSGVCKSRESHLAVNHRCSCCPVAAARGRLSPRRAGARLLATPLAAIARGAERRKAPWAFARRAGEARHTLARRVGSRCA